MDIDQISQLTIACFDMCNRGGYPRAKYNGKQGLDMQPWEISSGKSIEEIAEG